MTREDDTLWIAVPGGEAGRHGIAFVDSDRCDEFEAVLR